MWIVGIVLAVGAVAVVGVMLWIANSRLRSYETAIANT
jgi:hypothetical protein